MHSNGGVSYVNKIANLPCYGVVWFDENSLANSLLLANVAKKFHVTYDSKKGNQFVVYGSKNTLIFKQCERGLYYHKVVLKPKQSHATYVNFVQTVSENEQLYTPRQLERAKEAQCAYIMIGRPSIHMFKSMIQQNMIRNCPINTDDIKRAMHIYGVDLGATKRKTTSKMAPHINNDNIMPGSQDILDAHNLVTICIDFFKFDNINYFVSISRDIQFGTVQQVNNFTTETMFECSEHVVSLYKAQGFNPKYIYADEQFKCLKNQLMDSLQVTLVTVPKGTHVKEVERFVRTIKERVRSMLLTLPFKAI